MAKQVEHWFNRRYGSNRRDLYLISTGVGWQVVGRVGGAEGRSVPHYFDDEDEARDMLRRMREEVPEGQNDWVQVTAQRKRPQ
ncbi:hypothetical protein [Paractinoplanes brasiliensis]|nr:hypothetical protein [Actinoplanes brasiliensis]